MSSNLVRTTWFCVIGWGNGSVCRGGSGTRALAIAYERSLSNIDSDQRTTGELICSLHKSWLGGVYQFAGTHRTANVSKNNILFCPAMNIGAQIAELEKGLLASTTPCKASSIPELAAKLAEVHAELILIHPFRARRAA